MEYPKDPKTGIHKLPNVDRIQGVRLIPHADPQKAQVVAQYTDHNKQFFELKMPLLESLYLMMGLEVMAKEQNFDRLRQQALKDHEG